MTERSKMGMSAHKASEVYPSESNLKKCRVKKGLSQSELAAAAGLKKRLIQSYEQGERSIDHAKLETLCDIGIALDCGIEEILEDETLAEKFKRVK